MNPARYRIAPYEPGQDIAGFECGDDAYNEWLTRAATQAHQTGTAHVSVLLERDDADAERVVGYFAICPTLVVREQMPKAIQRRMLRSTPGWLVAKLAIDKRLRGRPEQWGRQLLREALLAIIAAAERGGGAVIVVDADNPALVPFYERNGFLPTGGDGLRMFMKVATARAYLLEQPPSRSARGAGAATDDQPADLIGAATDPDSSRRRRINTDHSPPSAPNRDAAASAAHRFAGGTPQP